MTFQELKDFCNSLDESQLSKNVVLWREDEGVSNISAMTLEEDHYIDPDCSENGCFPFSEAESFLAEEDQTVEDLEKVYDKGHPILVENF